MENVPVPARGICSGILQQGYSCGYLLAAVINLGVVPKVAASWRALYFIGAGFSCLAALVRAFLPESQQFILARQEAKEQGLTSGSQSKAFAKEVGTMLKTNWLRSIWAICMMTGKAPSHLLNRRLMSRTLLIPCQVSISFPMDLKIFTQRTFSSSRNVNNQELTHA